MANKAKADVLIRLHCNGSESSSAHGAMTICTTKNSPYVPELYQKSYRLSQKVLDSYVKATGARKEYIWETDSMSGKQLEQGSHDPDRDGVYDKPCGRSKNAKDLLPEKDGRRSGRRDRRLFYESKALKPFRLPRPPHGKIRGVCRGQPVQKTLLLTG